MKNLTKLNTFALTLLITGSIDSIRNLPASALFGSTLIFFFIAGAIFFLIPTALISAELTANFSEGGIYQWCNKAFGERIGFLGIWLQWINSVIWFPTILSFVAGTAAFLIKPELAQNKFYLIGIILFLFWSLTFINLKGVRFSSKFTSFCTLTGLILPMSLIILLFFAWLFLGKPIQIHFTTSNIFPDWYHSNNWIGLTAIMLSFCGIEIATVHLKDVSNPQRTFPKSLALSTIIILFTMVLGSLAIACVLPYEQINLVNGTSATFSYFLSAYHLSMLFPLITILLIIGSLGGTINWVIAPIKGLSQAAKNGFLPPFFQEDKQEVPQNLLIIQAILVSFVCLAFLLFPGVNGSYWLLTALSTQLYMLMYALMFVAALTLRKKITYGKDTFRIPGKKFGYNLTCILGLIGCIITLIVGFIPPAHLNIGSASYYEAIFCTGLVSLILPVYFFYAYKKRQEKIKLESISLNPEESI